MRQNIFKETTLCYLVTKGLRKHSSDNFESDVQKKLELAKKITSREKGQIKTAAFKIIFSKLLETPPHESASIDQKGGVESRFDPLDAKKLELAKKCLILKEELDDIFSIREDSIKIIAPISGNESFKRLIASLCYLIAAEIILGKEWVESKELAEVMREIGVADLANLAPQLKKNNDLFRIDAKPGNSKYKLTSGVGRQKAFEAIRKLAKGELFES